MLLDYQINDVAPYINWDYFFYAWGMHNKPEAEKEKLRGEAEETLATLQSRYRTHAVFQLFEANSEGDDIVIGERRIPLRRQQQSDAESLCLADFIRPLSSGKKDKIGVFATSVDMGLETDFDHDTYQKMMVQLLADRLAEATAERMHEEVRKNYWGYAPDEQLTMQELHIEKFQGIRPALGYPSLPDTSLNFVIDELIGMRQIGEWGHETSCQCFWSDDGPSEGSLFRYRKDRQRPVGGLCSPSRSAGRSNAQIFKY